LAAIPHGVALTHDLRDRGERVTQRAEQQRAAPSSSTRFLGRADLSRALRDRCSIGFKIQESSPARSELDDSTVEGMGVVWRARAPSR
jgi:hypothetical protein